MLLQKDFNMTWVLVLGSTGMLLLCLGMIAFFFLYQKKLLANKLQVSAMEALHKDELLQNTIEQVEHERKRIARDLHDEVGMLFTLLSRKMDQIQITKDKHQYDLLFNETKELTDKGLKSTRRIAYNIIPPELETLGLAATLENFCSQIAESDAIQVDIRTGIFKDEPSARISLALFRITQELIGNTLRYADATAVQIELSDGDHIINYSYHDNGKGFDVNNKVSRKGLGLRGVDNRAHMINGEIKITSSPGNGFSVTIQIPK